MDTCLAIGAFISTQMAVWGILKFMIYTKFKNRQAVEVQKFEKINSIVPKAHQDEKNLSLQKSKKKQWKNIFSLYNLTEWLLVRKPEFDARLRLGERLSYFKQFK